MAVQRLEQAPWAHRFVLDRSGERNFFREWTVLVGFPFSTFNPDIRRWKRRFKISGAYHDDMCLHP